MQPQRNGQSILVGEDELEVRAYLKMALECQGYSIELAEDGDEVLSFLRANPSEFAAVLLDLIMPRRDGMEVLAEIRQFAPDLPVIVVSGAASTVNVVAAMKCGATDFVCKPVGHDDLLQRLRKALHQQATVDLALRVPAQTPKTQVFFGTTPRMQEIQALVNQVGSSEAPVLIQGETGTGKEILARELHAHSPRAGEVFLKLNCAALPSELVESELFGYERGAFTGAFQKKIGMFEAANGGTILLDEIGDMDFRLQAKLLQVLQDREFQRVGGKEVIRVDVRVMAATHRDLENAIRGGTFREDLYYRLNVLNLELPPLRERKEDIIPLAEYLLRKHSAGKTVTLTADLKRALLAHAWWGNIRELENVIRRLIVLRDPELIARELQVQASRKPLTASRPATPPEDCPSGPVENETTPILQRVTKAKQQAETEAILAALASTRWNRKQAAALLKIDYKALLYKMKKLGVEDQPAAGPTSSEAPLQIMKAASAV